MSHRVLSLSTGLLLLFVGGCCTSASNEPFECDQAFVKPIVIFDGVSADRKAVNFHVKNWCNYPNDLWPHSADYPCGQNPVASRGHVIVNDVAHQTLSQGFCGFTASENLKRGFWFPLPPNVTSGSVRVVIEDKKCDRTVESDPVSWSVEKSAPYELDPRPEAIQIN